MGFTPEFWPMECGPRIQPSVDQGYSHRHQAAHKHNQALSSAHTPGSKSPGDRWPWRRGTARTNGGKTPRPSSSGGTGSHLLAANGAVRNRCSLFKLLRFRKCWPRNRTVLSWATREWIIWLQAHLTLGELGFSSIKGHSDISPVLSGLAWG